MVLDITDEIQQLLKDILFRYENAQPITKASGKTGRALEIKMLSPLHGQILGPKYFGVLERGRKGGNVPKGFYYIIMQWAIDKGIQFSKKSDLQRFSYFTAQKIQREGTNLYLSGGRKDIFTEPIEQCFARLSEKISANVMEEINLNNLIFKK